MLFQIRIYLRSSAAKLFKETRNRADGESYIRNHQARRGSAGNSGHIIQRINDAGFKLRAMKTLHITLKQAEGFYAVHRERPFFAGLTEFMSSAPCVVIVLEKEDAVKAWRNLMGATDPAKADERTLRKDFGGSVGENAVHGSDSDENAAIEIAYFFSQIELI